ncbi:MAG TPA: sigma-70 family RNA polymerase sigma factor [Polyangiaceae bacterium]|nr:sigma-70 family RNA polymerase sigma factor [Polyangiaceae bacterium]
MLNPDEPFTELRTAREHFLALVAEARPDLHRYCARMTGSVSDGEDVVQDTLARAYFMLPELPAMPELRPWLFRVAHNRALDFLRRYERRMSEPLDADAPFVAEGPTTADDALAGQQAVAAALGRFLELPPVPRSCVILKDVLGHSLDEIAAQLELALPAVKAALHRGRERLRAPIEAAPGTPPGSASPSPIIARYIELFNARDWDAVRAMLADDVRLDVVSRAQRRGRREVGAYVNNYANAHDWQLRSAWLGDREVIAVMREATATTAAYFVELTVDGERVKHIRDFRYVPYIATDAPLRFDAKEA